MVLAVIPGRSWVQFLAVLLVYAAYALAVLLAPQRDDPADTHSSGDTGDRVENVPAPAATEPSGG